MAVKTRVGDKGPAIKEKGTFLPLFPDGQNSDGKARGGGVEALMARPFIKQKTFCGFPYLPNELYLKAAVFRVLPPDVHVGLRHIHRQESCNENCTKIRNVSH